MKYWTCHELASAHPHAGVHGRFRNLTAEELMLYQVIKSAGNTGLWTKDMRSKTNLAQPHITKILKTLENRKLVKAVKSVNNPSRKVFMLYELDPSRELTGGAWCVSGMCSAMRTSGRGWEVNWQRKDDRSRELSCLLNVGNLRTAADRYRGCGASADNSRIEIWLRKKPRHSMHLTTHAGNCSLAAGLLGADVQARACLAACRTPTSSLRPACGLCQQRKDCTFLCHIPLVMPYRYTENQFDAEFIEVLREACYKFIQHQGDTTVHEVAEFIRKKGFSKVEERGMLATLGATYGVPLICCM
eukprot:12978-Chlamydomonas_euryale.AAC.4